MAELGITTLGQLAAAPLRTLEPVFGAHAPAMRERACGRGDSDLGRDRPAFREHDPDGEVLGSISNERTFHADVPTRPVEAMLCSLCESVSGARGGVASKPHALLNCVRGLRDADPFLHDDAHASNATFAIVKRC